MEMGTGSSMDLRVKLNNSQTGPDVLNKRQLLKSESDRRELLKLEFKRYSKSNDCLETYVAKIPVKQEKIIQFFKMIKPLIEGSNLEGHKLQLDPISISDIMHSVKERSQIYKV